MVGGRPWGELRSFHRGSLRFFVGRQRLVANLSRSIHPFRRGFTGPGTVASLKPVAGWSLKVPGFRQAQASNAVKEAAARDLAADPLEVVDVRSSIEIRWSASRPTPTTRPVVPDLFPRRERPPPENSWGLRLRLPSHFETTFSVNSQARRSLPKRIAVRNIGVGSMAHLPLYQSRGDLPFVVRLLRVSKPVVTNCALDTSRIERNGGSYSTIEAHMTRALVSTACLAIFYVVSTFGVFVASAEEKVRVHYLECVRVRRRRRLVRRVRRRYRVRRQRTVARAVVCAPSSSGPSSGPAWPPGSSRSRTSAPAGKPNWPWDTRSTRSPSDSLARPALSCSTICGTGGR